MQREERDQIYSKKVRAGKRTYFFDVRATRSSDYYLTITESRRFQRDGDFAYEKSKMFVYKEDFEKFVEALQDTVDHIKKELIPDYDFSQFNNDEATETFISGESVNTVTEEIDLIVPAETTPLEEASEDLFGDTDLKWE